MRDPKKLRTAIMLYAGIAIALYVAHIIANPHLSLFAGYGFPLGTLRHIPYAILILARTFAIAAAGLFLIERLIPNALPRE